MNFDLIWERYPKKVGKKDALRFFNSSVKSAEDFKCINRALDIYVNSERVRKGYIQDGSRWFRNWRDWADMTEEKQRIVNRTLHWVGMGLSPCHGSSIFTDDDGFRRCSSCISKV